MKMTGFDAVITIPGEPVAWPRVKTGRYGQRYDPSKKQKESFALQCMAQWRPNGFPTDKKIEVYVCFFCGGKVKDGDNMYKFCADSLEGIYWENDRQIKSHTVHVRDNSENPRTVLMIKVLDE